MSGDPKATGRWRWRAPALLVAAIGAGVAGYLDTHVMPLNDYLSVEAIVAVCLFATLAGVLCPRLAWLTSLMIGLGVAAFHFVTEMAGISVPRPLPLHPGDLLALIPALICAAAGAGWRLFLSKPIPKGR
jgi:peptidoglycan/LPS O-acetylase OafA/YrhL